MTLRVSLGDWATQQPEAHAIRYEVFVLEQKVPLEMEWDEMDTQCLHAVAYLKGDDGVEQAVGTGRLLPDGHIGRMAVKQPARGAGVGAAILQALMQQAQLRRDKLVQLNAQSQAEAFYARHGFVREGEEFEEAGIRHIHMQQFFD